MHRSIDTMLNQLEVELQGFKILLNNEIFVCQPANLPTENDLRTV